jgi:3-deoxy-D-manno-octulosonate 8-phosphate phosphatase (KDO 8-P phosphatase)
MQIPSKRARNIKLVMFDVDGVLTDGSIIYTSSGEEIKVFHVKDGMGIARLHAAGIKTAVISSRDSGAVHKRCAELGIHDVFLHVKDKRIAFDNLLAKYGLKAEQTAFMGDDLVDLSVMQIAGLAACPADAVQEVIAISHFISQYPGGRGAVREFAEFILKAL